MSEDLIRVEIITPVHNRREITLQCLKSLAKINKKGLDIHIVVVDDGSTDGTSEAIEKDFPEVEVVRGDGTLWFTEGTNVGIRAALKNNPKYVLLINDDEVFDADFLQYMVETAEKYPRSVIGSLLLLWDTPHKLFQVAPRWETLSGGWRHWAHQTIWTIPSKPWKVDLIVGNCVLVPTEAIKENGLMDSGRYPNFGDAEYTPRLKRKGWQLLIDPRARVFCQPNNLPVSLRSLGLKKLFQILIVDLKHIHNLRRRFYSNIDGAPTRWQGIAGFSIFFFRLLLRKNSESSWSETQKEQPLSEIFADSVVK
jgi:GT2 family glycosyltransferase